MALQEKGSESGTTKAGISSPMSNQIPESHGSGSASKGPSHVSSPFKDAMPTKGMKDDAGDVYDRNSCPAFSKPRDMGPDSIPTVFHEGEPKFGEGHDPHISSPFKDGIK